MISLKSSFRQKFITGMIVSIPALVSAFVLVWLFHIVDGFASPIYDRAFGRHIEGLGFVSFIIFVFFVGLFATNVIGKKVIGSIERLLLAIPVLKSVYSPMKSIMDAFSNSSSFKKFVIVEYPRPGVYAFGFLTKDNTIKTFTDGSSQKLFAVYIPTNHLYFGEIALFSEKDIFYTDIAIEDGVKIILSGGIATPQFLKEVKK